MSDFKPTLPADWPTQVAGPGLPDWEKSASKWLIDHAPGAWRDGLSGQIYRRAPLMLARDVRYLVEAHLAGLRDAYRRARVELADHFEPNQIEEKLEQYKQEGARLAALHKQVQLVEDALSGVRWVPRSVDFS
ncbi:hypothetical protein ABIA32_002723 [Streptacidiphilus sp. MAP12-20]|uniref:hypothetical protein n=1 Tax=Streptacidiphilus sp. MAP12-20 TaxID=3156299 RepID=UPI0035119501